VLLTEVIDIARLLTPYDTRNESTLANCRLGFLRDCGTGHLDFLLDNKKRKKIIF
jgi:hypothetical protein